MFCKNPTFENGGIQLSSPVPRIREFKIEEAMHRTNENELCLGFEVKFIAKSLCRGGVSTASLDDSASRDEICVLHKSHI